MLRDWKKNNNLEYDEWILLDKKMVGKVPITLIRIIG